jgi:HemY protein
MKLKIMTFFRVFKLIAFFIILAAIAIAMSNVSGEVIFILNGLRIEVPLTFFVIGFSGFSLSLVALRALWKAIWLIPEKYHRFLEKKRLMKAQNLILDAAAALAASQPEEADECATLASHLVPQDPVVLYMAAQSASASNNMEKAIIYFNTMLNEPRLKFLGLCGLIQDAQQKNDFLKAAPLLKQALKLRHDSPKLIELLQKNNLKLLENNMTPENYKDEMYKFLTREELAIYTSLQLFLTAKKQEELTNYEEAKNLLKKALNEAPSFTSAAIALSYICLQTSIDNKTFKILLKTASLAPHAQLLNNMLALGKYETPTIAYHFFSEQLSMDHYENLLFLSTLAGNASLMDIAKQLAEKAVSIYPTLRAYQQLANIMATAPGNINSPIYSADTIKPDATWHCHSCAHAYNEFHVFCPNCDDLNTINYGILEKKENPPTHASQTYLLAG